MSKKPLEKELKFGLSPADFAKLLAASHPRRPKTQINTYLDTAKLDLKRRGAGLRVRIEDGKRAYLTLKCALPTTAAGARKGHHARQEWECRLPLARARRLDFAAWRNSVRRQVDRLWPDIAARLQVVGSVRTRRTPIRIGRFFGELDAWSVGTHRFFELEVETDSLPAAEKAVRARFRELGIRARPRATTKLATLFRLRKRSSRR